MDEVCETHASELNLTGNLMFQDYLKTRDHWMATRIIPLFASASNEKIGRVFFLKFIELIVSP